MNYGGGAGVKGKGVAGQWRRVDQGERQRRKDARKGKERKQGDENMDVKVKERWKDKRKNSKKC